MNRIGLDAHSASFTVAVVNDLGKVTRCVSQPTSAENLIRVVGEVPGPKELVVEESAVAQWVKDTLEPYVDKLVVCDPRRNRWIAKDDFSDDRSSAIKLAQLLRGGYIKEVCHLDDRQAQLRRVFCHYGDLNEQVVRFKNKLKATYRQAAIPANGEGIYSERRRGEWLARLKEAPALHRQAGQLFVLIDTIEAMKQDCLKVLVAQARKDKGYRLLLTIPGVGSVLACGYIALIATPHRFSRKNKLWRYAGLGNALHISDETVYDERGARGLDERRSVSRNAPELEKACGSRRPGQRFPSSRVSFDNARWETGAVSISVLALKAPSLVRPPDPQSPDIA